MGSVETGFGGEQRSLYLASHSCARYTGTPTCPQQLHSGMFSEGFKCSSATAAQHPSTQTCRFSFSCTCLQILLTHIYVRIYTRWILKFCLPLADDCLPCLRYFATWRNRALDALTRHKTKSIPNLTPRIANTATAVTAQLRSEHNGLSALEFIHTPDFRTSFWLNPPKCSSPSP